MRLTLPARWFAPTLVASTLTPVFYHMCMFPRRVEAFRQRRVQLKPGGVSRSKDGRRHLKHPTGSNTHAHNSQLHSTNLEMPGMGADLRRRPTALSSSLLCPRYLRLPLISPDEGAMALYQACSAGIVSRGLQ
ncbi:hypothetical protein GGR57DRAFT_237965 [Xylariaceae sp. FL1272]|nr:hypothetical protein GGR57DRAFT_237965 [Xylariaceae sp. FL1272]